jgi:hypothetical protein
MTMSSLAYILGFSVRFYQSDTILKWDYRSQIWFSGFREEDLNVIIYQNMPNLHNVYKSAERKIPQENLD